MPLGARAAAWVRKYLEQGRPQLTVDSEVRELFLNPKGTGLSPSVLGNLVHGYIKQSGINKTGSCHLFRHAMATLMLENGADRRYVKEMLGHARLDTTEIYTHVNIQKLIEVHRHTHPARRPEIDKDKSLNPDLKPGLENVPDKVDMGCMKYLDRITFNPKQCGGRPCIRGMRIRVKDVLDLLAAEVPEREILKNYPYLEFEDIRACLEYAA